MKRNLAWALALCTSVCPGAWAQEAETEGLGPRFDPEAVEIAAAAADFLARQPRIALDWFVSYDVIVDGREKITYTRSGTNLLSRGEGFYAYSENRDRVREYFYDGGAFWLHNVEDDAYVEIPFAGSFETLVERIRVEYDIPLPIWELLSRAGTDGLLAEVEAAAYLGETLFAGRPVHHLAFAQYDQDWQVWVSTDPERPEIVALIGTDPYTQGWPQYRAYFHNWDFDPEFAEGAFTFEPGPDAIRMALPKVESAAAAELDALLSGGARAGGGDAENQ